jgi:hypothetical protein
MKFQLFEIYGMFAASTAYTSAYFNNPIEGKTVLVAPLLGFRTPLDLLLGQAMNVRSHVRVSGVYQ